MTFAELPSIRLATAATSPSLMAISAGLSRSFLGSIRCPPWMMRSKSPLIMAVLSLVGRVLEAKR